MSNQRSDIIEIVEQCLEDFLQEFIKNPYLCYTEHGIHALFFQRLYDALPEKDRYIEGLYEGKSFRVCRIQKEYPTYGNLGKSQRQHWDISVLADPSDKVIRYDKQKLICAIEFGLNTSFAHLCEDSRRLRHKDANLGKGFVVHLYRLSEAYKRISGRDISRRSREVKAFIQDHKVVEKHAGKKVTLYAGLVDLSDAEAASPCLYRYDNGKWQDFL